MNKQPAKKVSSPPSTRQADKITSIQIRQLLAKFKNTNSYWLGRWYQWQKLRKQAKEK